MILTVDGSSTTKAALKSLGISITLWLICAFCLLTVGGKAATVVIVLYSILAGLGFLGALYQAISPRQVSMGVGIVVENGKKVTKFENYDEVMSMYENRYSTWLFWLSTSLSLGWIALFLLAGVNFLAYTVVILYIISEIAKYRIYKCIKKNKDTWGAVMYINEIQNFFGGHKR